MTARMMKEKAPWEAEAAALKNLHSPLCIELAATLRRDEMT